MLNDPDLLVLDEPTEGLDLGGRRLLVDVVREWREKGRTVVVVTHLVREIEPLLDRIVVIVGGKTVFKGPPAELTQNGSVSRPLEEVLNGLYACDSQ